MWNTKSTYREPELFVAENEYHQLSFDKRGEDKRRNKNSVEMKIEITPVDD